MEQKIVAPLARITLAKSLSKYPAWLHQVLILICGLPSMKPDGCCRLSHFPSSLHKKNPKTTR